MTKLLHLTDLHFGADRQDLITSPRDAILEAAPDMRAVSGDLSHRARPGQFRAAVGFFESLALRLFGPFRPWRQGVPERLRPGETKMGHFRLFTANTADPTRIRPGVLRERDVRQTSSALQNADKSALNVLVCHHPIKEPPGLKRGKTRSAERRIAYMVHHWQIGLGVTGDKARPLLQIQSGTALCARPAEKERGFSRIESHVDGITVTPWLIDEELKRFFPAGAVRFRQGEDGWRVVSA